MEALEAAAKELREHGRTVYTQAVDVSDEAAVTGFVETAAQELGGLDIVISNVSAGGLKGADQWQTSFQADLLAFVRLVEAAVPHLEQSDAAAVVVLGTTSAFDTLPPTSANSYAAFKAAVLEHASGLGHALARKGIRVNTVSPGPIDFPGGAWDKLHEARPEFYETIRARIPVGRLGRRGGGRARGHVPGQPGRELLHCGEPRRRRRLRQPRPVLDGGRARPAGRLTPFSSAAAGGTTSTTRGYQLLGALGEWEQVRTRVFEDYGCLDALERADLLVTYTCDVRPTPEQQDALVELRRAGRPVAGPARHPFGDRPAGRRRACYRTPRVLGKVAELLGGQFLGHPPIAPYTVHITAPEHPLVAGIQPFEVRDELYVLRAAPAARGAAARPVHRRSAAASRKGT